MGKPVEKQKPGRKPYDVTDFPHADWNQSVEQLQKDLGIGHRAAWRLRQEARELIRAHSPGRFKPVRAARRSYSVTDFPGVDWSRSTVELIAKTGLSRTIVYRLLREAGVDPADRKPKHQRQARKYRGETPTPISKS